MNENCPCDAVKELQREVREHEARLHEGDTTLALIKQNLETMQNSISLMARDIREIKEKPARRAESWGDTAIKYIITALLTYISVRLGLA